MGPERYAEQGTARERRGGRRSGGARFDAASTPCGETPCVDFPLQPGGPELKAAAALSRGGPVCRPTRRPRRIQPTRGGEDYFFLRVAFLRVVFRFAAFLRVFLRVAFLRVVFRLAAFFRVFLRVAFLRVAFFLRVVFRLAAFLRVAFFLLPAMY